MSTKGKARAGEAWANRSPLDSINFRQLSKDLLPFALRICERFLPGGKLEGKEYKALNPRRADRTIGSFSANIETGLWADFAEGKKGGDPISLVGYVLNCSNREAAEILAREFLGIELFSGNKGNKGNAKRRLANNRHLQAAPSVTQEGIQEATKVTEQTENEFVSLPAPGEPPEELLKNTKAGPVASVHKYRDREGRLRTVVRRVTKSGGEKAFFPLTYGRLNGREGWHSKGYPGSHKPPYQSDVIAGRPDAEILWCEGEKAADAAQRILPGYVATTNLQGAGSIHLTDWSQFRNRKVTLWPDADRPGKSAVRELIPLLLEEGVESVHVFNYLAVARPPGQVPCTRTQDVPEGFDAADAEGLGWDGTSIKTQQRHLQVPLEEAEGLLGAEPEQKKKVAAASRFLVRDDGVYYVADDDSEPLWLASKIEVIAFTRDDHGRNHGLLLRITDRDGTVKEWCMPAEMLGGSGEEYRRALLSIGASIATGSRERNLLSRYFQTALAASRLICVTKTGWNGDSYVLPEVTIGPAAGKVIYQSSEQGAKFEVRGTLVEWSETIARLSINNSRIILAISLAFVSVLLELVRAESGGVHFRGHSSIGKTTALLIGRTVFGVQLVTWRTTSNGLEYIAAQYNDQLLILDEIGQVDPEKIAENVYMLGNGQGKVRATARGNLRAHITWRGVFLSSGEKGLNDLARAVGNQLPAGLDVRLFDVPADAGAGLGIFEDLHGRASGDRFAQELCALADKYHGAAGMAFVRYVVENRESLIGRLGTWRNKLVNNWCPNDAAGQVRRAADRFALIAIAGELATEAGITGWTQGHTEDCIKRCFDAWLQARGSAAQGEDTAALEQIRRFLERHGEARFAALNECGDRSAPDRPVIDRAGFRRNARNGEGVEFLVLPQVFRSELCKGFDSRFVTKVCIREGWLQPANDGKPQRTERLPDFGPTRVYVFTPKVFAG